MISLPWENSARFMCNFHLDMAVNLYVKPTIFAKKLDFYQAWFLLKAIWSHILWFFVQTISDVFLSFSLLLTTNVQYKGTVFTRYFWFYQTIHSVSCQSSAYSKNKFLKAFITIWFRISNMQTVNLYLMKFKQICLLNH